MKRYTVKFKDNGKAYGYGYHIGMYRLFGAESAADEISVPRFHIIGNGIVQFYTDDELKNSSVLALPAISEDIDTVATGFNIMFAPTRKDRHYSGKAVPVQPTTEGNAYIKEKLIALMVKYGISDVSEIHIEYGHTFSEQFKKGIGVHKIMSARATVQFNAPHDIHDIVKNGYGKFKFDGMGCVTQIFHDSESKM